MSKIRVAVDHDLTVGIRTALQQEIEVVGEAAMPMKD